MVLDQSRLPGEERYVTLRTVAEVADAIRTLQVRGAPLIGIVGAMGVALAAREPGDDSAAAVRKRVDRAGRLLAATRPTAVNLRWAIDRMLAVTQADDARCAATHRFPGGRGEGDPRRGSRDVRCDR